MGANAIAAAMGLASTLIGVASAYAQALPDGVSGDARVALVLPSRPPSALSAAIVRVQGELTAAGFPHTVITDDARTREGLEATASSAHAIAALAFARASDGGPEIWVCDLAHRQTTVKRVPRASGAADDAMLLAFSAVDLLRASLAEVWTERARARDRDDVAPSPSRSDPVVAAPAAPPTMTAEPASASLRWGVALQARVLAPARAWLWGAAAALARPTGPRSALEAELAAEGGALPMDVASTTMALASASLKWRIQARAAAARPHAALGATGGVFWLSAAVADPTAYRGRSAVAPWGGPEGELGIDLPFTATLRLGVAAAVGYALVAPRGVLPDDAHVRFGGGFALLRLTARATR
jgi:hypothetical protein